MPQFSLIIQVRDPIKDELTRLLDSLQAQTDGDWQAVLAVGLDRPQDWALVQELLVGRTRIQAIQRPAEDSLARLANHLALGLGSWFGFLDQHDQLTPAALATMRAAIDSPAGATAKVIYSDEAHSNVHGRLSYVTAKGPLDQYRLLTQEYLGSLALINLLFFVEAKGFDPLASDVPTHDLYLRLVEARGQEAFLYVPQVLCHHHRDYLAPPATDVRLRPHVARYDLYAVRQCLSRRHLPAQVTQIHGTVRIDFKYSLIPGVVLWILVGDDVAEGTARIHAANATQGHRLVSAKIIHRGTSEEAKQTYHRLARSNGWGYLQTAAGMPQLLNQELPRLEHDLLAILDGVPITRGWLAEMVDYSRLPKVAAVGAKCGDPREILAPGVLGYRYAGWDWNTRGRFNQMQVTHQTGALGSGCLLLSSQLARVLGPFREDLPTLWAMEYSLRADANGYALLSVPQAHIHTRQVPAVDPAEETLLRTEWAGWIDRFGLHASL